MGGSRRGARGVAALAGALAIGVAVWWLLGEARSPRHPGAPAAGAGGSPASEAASPPPAEATPQGPRIASGGRLRLEADALPKDGPLLLTLELEDAARGGGAHPVRVISEDGKRRLDLEAAPRAGAGSGLRLQIDPAFLTRGRYMIEIETDEPRPLRIRRYVLEIG